MGGGVVKVKNHSWVRYGHEMLKATAFKLGLTFFFNASITLAIEQED